MIRIILAVIGGILLGGLVVGIVEMIGHTIYPPPKNFDFNDPEALKRLIEQLPVGAILFVILAYAVGSFCGGLFAAWISVHRRTTASLIVGGFLMFAGVMNLIMIPSPIWFSVLTLFAFLPFSYLASRVVAYCSKVPESSPIVEE